MDTLVERAIELKQALVDFVYEAEGDLAVALETYAAAIGSRERYHMGQQELTIDTFLTEGEVGNKTPLELFLESQSELTQSDRALLSNWGRSFTGLFQIMAISGDGYEVMNWLTAKHYKVLPNSEIVTEAEIGRWKPGEIILSRITPIADDYWMFSGACISKGRLGKPKLAVAVGEFKQNYKDHLYSDAPELLEQAWNSVAQYHQDFVEFFGSDRVTLPGYELNKKIADLQEQMSQKRLAAAGIDSSKSLKEIAKEAGADEDSLEAAAVEAGAEEKAVAKAMSSSMVTSKVDLPEEIKKAERVTTFSHPRWGQMFVPTYSKFQAMLEAREPEDRENSEALVRKYLKDPQINFFIWQQLQEEYPKQLEKMLQTVLERPDFDLQRDLEATLVEFNKPLEPELPEIASVPKHLNDLFEEAVAQVHKSKSKSKKKKKKTKGFS